MKRIMPTARYGSASICLMIATGSAALHTVENVTQADRPAAPFSADTVLADQITADMLHPLPETARVIRHGAACPVVYNGTAPGEPRARRGASGVSAQADSRPNVTPPRAGGAEEKLIYSNTRGSLVYSLPLAGARIADDIFTEALGECPLNRYLIRVTGGVADGANETFDTIVALTDYCPSTDYWGPTIPGTELRFTNLTADADTVHELVIDFQDPNLGICTDQRACRISEQDCSDGSNCVERTAPVAIPPSVWLRVEFTTSQAGWVVGEPATIGYSADRYDNYFVGCNTTFGGYPEHPHASFYAEFFAPQTCESHHLAYLATAPHEPAFIPYWGTESARLADDIELAIDSCELSTIRVGTKGYAGPYEIEFDLRPYPDGDPFPGSVHTFVSMPTSGLGNLDVATLLFDPGLFVDRWFWITWRANKRDTGLINAGVAQLGGESLTPGGDLVNRMYAAFDSPFMPGDWAYYLAMEDGSDAIFDVAVYCRGTPPRGACCRYDATTQESTCTDDATVAGCRLAEWREGLRCDEDPFTPSCGAHVCCLPDNTCANLVETDCAGAGGLWEPGGFCEEGEQDCGWFTCHGSHDSCHLVHATPGCTDSGCCNLVCDLDPYCCSDAWDEVCLSWAAQMCGTPPHNDRCWSEQPGLGALRLDANSSTIISLHGATADSSDPDICCYGYDPGERMRRTAWFTFELPEGETSARIHTCHTPYAPAPAHSILQLFGVADPDLGICTDGSACSVTGGDCPPGEGPCGLDQHVACETLVPIACDDEGEGCGADIDTSADLCVSGLDGGEVYYVLLGTTADSEQNLYQLDVEVPCPQAAANQLPENDECSEAPSIDAGATQFDLTNATFKCPGEACLPAMKNDVWFDYQPDCTGTLIVRTCDLDPQTPEEDTTLAVYEGSVCPPDEESLLGCNDDAEASHENHVIVGMPQACAGVRNECYDYQDCSNICTIGQNRCADIGDCAVGICTDHSVCDFWEQDCSDGSWCLPNETCEPGDCISACSPGSMVVIPVSDILSYKIRLGGADGSEPTGDLTITCIDQDCNGNHIYDGQDLRDCLAEELWCRDCNLNSVPDMCDLTLDQENWRDCQSNEIPDRCEIHWSSNAPGGPFYCIDNCIPDVNGNGVPDDCEVLCPDGTMDWESADPPDGFVDARQPHALYDTEPLPGVSVIEVVGPGGALDLCWLPCETGDHSPPSGIDNISDDAGTYTITLTRQLRTGERTTITYTDDADTATTGWFAALPGDTNADGTTDTRDVTAHADCCLRGTCAPHGAYSCDINRSGQGTVEDLLRVLDLFNGAHEYEPWYNRTLPKGGCP